MLGTVLQTVARFLDPWEAHIVCARLNAEDIPASVGFANHAIVDWPAALALGGTAVQVPDDYIEQARALVAAYHAGELGLEATDAISVPDDRCPRCGSADLRPVIPWHQRALVVLLSLFGATFPTGEGVRECGTCGYRKS